MFLLYHVYVYLEFLILACTIYILAPRGLASKWENVLKGDTKWLEKYRSSSRYAKENLTADEKEIFDDGWVLDTKSLP